MFGIGVSIFSWLAVRAGMLTTPGFTPWCQRGLKSPPPPPLTTKSVLRARGTLFQPKMARELMKFNRTCTIRSEIARGIVSNRSQGPEMDKMKVFDTLTCTEASSHPPRYDNSKGVSREKKFKIAERFWIFFRSWPLDNEDFSPDTVILRIFQEKNSKSRSDFEFFFVRDLLTMRNSPPIR